MDMKRIRRQLSPSKPRTDPENDGFPRSPGRKSGSNMVRWIGIFVVCLMGLPVLVTFGLIYRDPTSSLAHGSSTLVFSERNTQKDRTDNVEGGRRFEAKADEVLEDSGISQSADVLEDKLLGGLLAAEFDEASCLSRYQSVLYRKESTQKPSSSLLAKLRKYEDLHKKCGPNTDLYNKTVDLLKFGRKSGTTDCNYVVWISYSGLGNRILNLASTFLYALLTDRVLLVDRGADMGDLFCEPFPEASWLLPLDFPLNQFENFDQESPQCFGNMLKNNIINDTVEVVSAGSLPTSTYLHLAHDYDDHDKLFFCEQHQLLLQKIPWLILRSNNYFVPSLFLIPMFEQELSILFPKKDTVFHHLGRYLFHPSNSVWGLITRFYQAYLAHANELIGIQIRVFDTGTGPFQHVMDQILACCLNEKLLPKVAAQKTVSRVSNPRSKVVLMTSLSVGYSENIRNMYWEHPTVSGEIVSVYQPSHEEYQQTEKQMHNMKAWAEMYLLSLTDVLVTSSWSTFGYVAQGLGGIKPWILYKPENQTAPDPPCRRAMSMEPCFHAPPFYDCKAKKGIDTGALVPYVRHCEDVSWGLKVVSEDGL